MITVDTWTFGLMYQVRGKNQDGRQTEKQTVACLPSPSTF